jgi:hypothetical protein
LLLQKIPHHLVANTMSSPSIELTPQWQRAIYLHRQSIFPLRSEEISQNHATDASRKSPKHQDNETSGRKKSTRRCFFKTLDKAMFDRSSMPYFAHEP